MSEADVRYLHKAKAKAKTRLRTDPKVVERIRELGGQWPIDPQELLELLEARHG